MKLWASFLAILLVGCIAQGQDNTSSILNDFIIMAYSGPPLEEVSLERYQEIADAGIGYLVPANGTFSAEQNRKAMDLGAQVGIKIVPVDLRVATFELRSEMEVDTAAIKAVANSYKDHPAMASYVVKDEPSGELFPVLREIYDVFRAEDPAHEPLINLFPNYGTIHQFGTADYPTYLRDYLRIVEPKLLAYDSYPLRNGGVTIYDDWYSNLEIVREEARKANIPFLVFIQSEGIGEGLRVPNRAEILWQATTVLAYGAQGVGWFCYWTPEPDQGFTQADGAKAPVVESHYNAMIDIKGNRTEVYDFVKEANHYLNRAGSALLEWDNVAVVREGGVVVGTFQKGEKVRLVVANASCDNPAVYSTEKREMSVFASIDAEPASESKWNLKPGGSMVLDLK